MNNEPLNKQNQPKSTIASITKAVCIIVIIILGTVGFVIGWNAMPRHYDGYHLWYPIGAALLGIFVGVLITLVLMNLSELGTNMRKTASATIETAKTNAAAELNEYKKLLDSGVITQEEFDMKKQQILNLNK